jgi:ABC-type phosphate/phosphonate transport system substrate-binding protein
MRLLSLLPVVAVVCCCMSLAAPAVENTRLTFIGVALDPETQKADQKLRDYFRARMPLKFENRDMQYGAAIRTLVDWNFDEQGSLMARITPYVYVVAEMLGADLEILATYLSRETNSRIYHSYLVVRRSDYDGSDLDGFVQYLRGRSTPARFIFHNKFSTSSFFLPSLYFHKRDIFSAAGQSNNRKYIMIHAVKPTGVDGSSDLVRRVKANEDADFAAVWDGTKGKFDGDPELNFLKLPDSLPNDLLVVSKSIQPEFKAGLQEALNKMSAQDIDIGDFLKWDDFNKTPDARRALATLRWMAKVTPQPVPIQIHNARGGDDGVANRYLMAAREAIRLSGTEFILFDEDFHQRFDVLWTLRKVHDDSLIIKSDFIDSGLEPQEFHISFKKDDMESLVLRIGSEITTKMHRIRYVWPFDDEQPRVLRDVKFNIPTQSVMRGMKITWNDFSTNSLTMGTPFDVTVTSADFNSFQLKGDGFPKRQGDSGFDFDPMSNTAYRVILMRPETQGLMIKIFSIVLIALFFLAAVFALKAAWRNPGNAA